MNGFIIDTQYCYDILVEEKKYFLQRNLIKKIECPLSRVKKEAVQKNGRNIHLPFEMRKIVIQMPKDISIEHLPSRLVDNQEFIVNNRTYICKKIEAQLKCVENKEIQTGVPEHVHGYFWIREK